MTKKFWNVAFDEKDIQGLVRCYDQSKEHVAYRIQWRSIDRYKSRNHDMLEAAGIYFMIERHARNDKPRIYVGQGDVRANGTGMLSRVKAHKTFKWCEEVVFLPIKDHYDASVLNHLECQFYKNIDVAGCYKLENKNVPHDGKVREELQQDVEEFVANAECLLAVLGFMPFTLRDKSITEAKDVLYGATGDKPKARTVPEKIVEAARPSQPKTDRAASFSFAEVNIPVGATLEFVDAPLTVTVLNDKKVDFKGKPYSLSGFTKAFHPNPNTSGAYQGPKHFTYKGKLLVDIRAKGLSDRDETPNSEETPTAVAGHKILCCRSRGADARGYATQDGFLVTKGSRIDLNETNSFVTCKQEVRMRTLLAADGTIKGDILTKDVTCPSISSAAKFVMGTSANGKKEWK